MDILSSVSVTFVIRWAHALAMMIVVGGSASLFISFLRPLGEREPARDPARLRAAIGYEWVFWIAIGLLVLTGVGNAGAFAGHLPTPETLWGRKFVLKLFGVLALILVSFLRTCLVAQWERVQRHRSEMLVPKVIGGLYGATLFLGVGVFTLALFLAHG